MRCICGGEIIDDIDYYNRVHAMLHICTSNSNRENDDIEGFGWRWDSRDTHSNAVAALDVGLVGNGGRGSASFKTIEWVIMWE